MTAGWQQAALIITIREAKGKPMKIDKETLLKRCSEERDKALVIAIITAPEEEVDYTRVVTNALALCAAFGAEIKDLQQMAEKVWNRVRLEIGGTWENFTTDLLRYLRDVAFIQRKDKDLYDELVCNEDFWRKYLMS